MSGAGWMALIIVGIPLAVIVLVGVAIAIVSAVRMAAGIWKGGT